MISIEYTYESVENEPGPNVYWHGNHRDFLRFLIEAHELGVSNGYELNVEDLDYVSLVGITSYHVRSTHGGITLCKKHGQSIEMELDSLLWRDILHKVLSISFGSGFVYQEFDEKKLIEQANIVMKSTWKD